MNIPSAGHNDTYSRLPRVWNDAWPVFLREIGFGRPEETSERAREEQGTAADSLPGSVAAASLGIASPPATP